MSIQVAFRVGNSILSVDHAGNIESHPLVRAREGLPRPPGVATQYDRDRPRAIAWMAWFDDFGTDAVIGRGSTEEEAIAAYQRQLEDVA